MNIDLQIFAVFVVCEIAPDLFCATTRCADKGEDSISVAFPGGKVDPGESIREAALRESQEEGFLFDQLDSDPFFIAEVEGHTVAWLRGTGHHKLATYKEQNRLDNTFASYAQLANQNPSFRNQEALAAFYAK